MPLITLSSSTLVQKGFECTLVSTSVLCSTTQVYRCVCREAFQFMGTLLEVDTRQIGGRRD